jgi:galactose mutarotase-like enzyme
MTVSTTPRAATARRTTSDGFPAVALRAGAVEARFVPSAGMAGVSLRHDGEELLALGEGLAAYVERGATMGIPFLHPWANRLAAWRYGDVELPRDLPHDEHGLPIHGVLPEAWRVEGLGVQGDRAALRTRLEHDSPAFPFPHEVEQVVTLAGAELTIATTLRATGSVAVPVAFGWHRYLRLPGVPRHAWRVTLPPRRRLLTDALGLPTGKAVWEPRADGALGGRAFDDGYDALGPAPRFAVAGGGRVLTVAFGAGYRVAQVFAPPACELICFEPMTAPVDALTSGRGLRHVAPGRSFRAAFTISIG